MKKINGSIIALTPRTENSTPHKYSGQGRNSGPIENIGPSRKENSQWENTPGGLGHRPQINKLSNHREEEQKSVKYSTHSVLSSYELRISQP